MDCVCIKPHKTHLNVEKAFSFIKEISPKRAGLIHMGHEIDHDSLQKMAEDSFDFPVFPLSDGMALEYCDELNNSIKRKIYLFPLNYEKK